MSVAILQARAHGIGAEVCMKPTSLYFITQRTAQGVPHGHNLTTWNSEPQSLVTYLGAVRDYILKSPPWQNSHVNTEIIHG
jgi:hypothetical protein